MALKLKYQGQETNRQENTRNIKVTYYGTQADVDTAMVTYVIGTRDVNYGTLTGIRKSQSNGNIYELQLTYTVTYNTTIDTDKKQQGEAQKITSTLQSRTLQMPLEKKANYKACWNYYLAGLGNATLPAWSLTATNTHLTAQQAQSYMWIKSVSELPTQPTSTGQRWKLLQDPIKPGVQYFEMAYFVVSEQKKSDTAAVAGQKLNKAINTITPPTETFGISGGNWKLDEGQISHDGKMWVTTNTYTHSPTGWDTDLYS